jgi:thioesterase domain-containing protein
VDEAVLVPVRLEPAAVMDGRTAEAARAQAPALVRGLIQEREEDAMPTAASAIPREQELLAVICAEAAGVLGYEGAEEVSRSLSFLEMGFDSLAAVKLRNRLGEITGLRLRSTIIFEYTSPRLLARYLREELAQSGGQHHTRADLQPAEPQHAEPQYPEPQHPEPRIPDPQIPSLVQAPRVLSEREPTALRATAARVTPAPAIAVGSDGSLNSLVWRAMKVGRADEVLQALAPLSRVRPAFSSIFDLGAVPEPVRLSTGPNRPALVCVTSVLGKSDPTQFARFVPAFRGNRDMWALLQPGFIRGELVPASVTALMEVHVATIRRRIAHSPFVLIGQSAGGLIANSLAGSLEAAGIPPVGVVLIDTYPPDLDVAGQIGDGLRELFEERVERLDDSVDGTTDHWGDAWVTAMVRYLEFSYTPQRTAAPTLLIRAQDGMPGWPADWQTEWPFDHDLADVPGNHFTMMEEHVDDTTTAIEAWISRRQPCL